jgi:putative tetratricopeptide repeat-containing domain protein
MKKILLVSFVLCSFYGFSAKASVQRSSTLKSENKAGKNIGEMTIKDTIKEISENDGKRFEEMDLEKKEKKEIMDLTLKELTELGINKKSIETTFKAMEEEKDYEKRRKLFLQAIEEDKRNYLPYYYLAQEADNIKVAMEYYKDAIKANPKNPMAYTNLVARYGQAGMKKEQLELAKKMITLFPEFPEGYYSIAAIDFQNENYSNSIKYAKLAIDKYDKMKKLDYSYVTESAKYRYKADAQYLVFLNYIQMKKYDEVFEYSKEAYIFMAQHDNDLRFQIYSMLADFTEEIKNKNKEKYKEYISKLNALRLAEELVKANNKIKSGKAGDKTIKFSPLKAD